MARIERSWIAIVAGVFLVGLLPLAQASEWDKKTIVTFSQQVEIPNGVMQPGTYVIKLLAADTNPDIVQFWNQDETQVYSTVIAIRDRRDAVPSKPEFEFYPMPKGDPPALKAWFYPGEATGWQFRYPEPRATQLANLTKQSVPAAPSTQPGTTTTAAAAQPAPQTQTDTGDSEEASAASYHPSPAAEMSDDDMDNDSSSAGGEPAATQAESSPAPAPDAEPALNSSPAARPKMPTTASDLPLIAILGLSLVGLAVVTRFERKRRS